MSTALKNNISHQQHSAMLMTTNRQNQQGAPYLSGRRPIESQFNTSKNEQELASQALINKNSTYKRKQPSKKSKKQSGSGYGTLGNLNSHSVEQPISGASRDTNATMTSLMQKIISGTNTITKSKASSREPNVNNMASQMSRNVKFKLGNSGMNMISGMSSYTTAGGVANYPNVASLTNFGGYGSKASIGGGSNNLSAYMVTNNASDLLRGFKSTQSIPVVSSQ